MNDKIRQHLTAFNENGGWGTSDKDLMETLTEATPVYKAIGSAHRWYDDEFRVVNIGGMLIGYNGFHITGDNGVSDMGLEYKIDSVCEVEKKEVTEFQYIRK